MVASDTWTLLCPLKFRTPPATSGGRRRMFGSPAVCVWSSATLMSLLAAYCFFTKLISAICQRRCSSMFRCCWFWCPMCTSAELHMIHVTLLNGKYMWAAFRTPYLTKNKRDYPLCGSVRFRLEQICAVTDSVSEQQRSVCSICRNDQTVGELSNRRSVP